MIAGETKTGKYRLRFAQLREEQNSWRPHWREIADFMLPRKGKYLESEQDSKLGTEGGKFHQKIINGSASDALRTIAAGMQGGLTSPSRPWFNLGLADESLSEYGPVREWLHQVRTRMLLVFGRSNFYAAIHGMYKELAAFGTAAGIIEEDFRTVIRVRPFTIGEYSLALDYTYRPEALYRMCAYTVRQMIEEYGKENVSDSVLSCFKANQLETRFEAVHGIEPNTSVNPEKADFRGMKYASVSYEAASDPNKFLKQSGYRTKPFVAPRWDVSGVNVYGDAPGMEALGDVKMLQKIEEKKLRALDKMVDPPMNAPVSMRKDGGNILPGGINYIESLQGQQSFSPAYMINPNLQQIAFEVDRVEQRIRRFFFNDLFLAILNEGKQMTATEVSRRYEEKLMMLGPVIERLQAEMLDPIIERVFDVMDSLGLLPPPPKEIAGMQLDVRYISLLAQAQRMVGTTAIEQTAAFVGALAPLNPQVVDKFDAEEAVDQYADATGVAPKIIRSDDAVAAMRAQRAKQQQAQAALAAAESASKTASNLGATPLGENSALDALLGNNPAGGMRNA